MEKRTFKFVPKCFEGKYEGYIEILHEKNCERQKRAVELGALDIVSMSDEEKHKANIDLTFKAFEIAKTLVVCVCVKKLPTYVDQIEINDFEELEYIPELKDLTGEMAKLIIHGFQLGNE